ncbi:13726_t:CDS:1, partial [Funneliformis mosseae]
SLHFTTRISYRFAEQCDNEIITAALIVAKRVATVTTTHQ